MITSLIGKLKFSLKHWHPTCQLSSLQIWRISGDYISAMVSKRKNLVCYLTWNNLSNIGFSIPFLILKRCYVYSWRCLSVLLVLSEVSAHYSDWNHIYALSLGKNDCLTLHFSILRSQTTAKIDIDSIINWFANSKARHWLVKWIKLYEQWTVIRMTVWWIITNECEFFSLNRYTTDN